MSAQSHPADIVIINANIRTIVTKDSRAQALAIHGDRISAVGSTSRIRKLIGTSTQVIDARGRLVLPGFNDAHVHFMGIGNGFSSIDLRYVGSAREMVERIARYPRYLPKGRWILGGTWNNSNWELPHRRSIDAVTPENPVFLYHADTRSALVNSLALQLANLKSDHRGVERDDKGEPTGIVRDAALARVRAVVPANHTRNWAEIAETATNYAASLGVTSVQDMHSDDSRDVYRELVRQGKLKTRVYDCIPIRDWKKLADPVRNEKRGAEMVRGGCLKTFSDGDPEAAPTLLREVAAADRAGIQIMVHAIGNSANEIVLGVFEQTIKENGFRDRRFRVEHAHNPRFADLPRFARNKIIASMQPHLFDGGSGEFYRSLFKLKTSVAFGSDAAMVDLNPLLGIAAAVNAGDESVSVYEAVRAYTRGSAYAEFQETQKGMIEPGKLADLVVLSDDIFASTPLNMSDVRAALTITAGRIVFNEDKLR